MAKLTRKNLIVFGDVGGESNFGKFGSKAAGSAVTTKDVELIQSLAAWNTNGWVDAINNSNKAPFIEDMNALHYVLSYMMAYQLQEGVPEWNASTTYYTGSIVKKTGTTELYGSLIDTNLNHVLPSQTDNSQWKYLNPDPIVYQQVPTGTVIDFAAVSAPSGWLLCDGTAVSRTTYSALFAVIGTAFGTGDGSTTFNLPDCRGRSTIGTGAGSGLTNRAIGDKLGEETHLLITAEIPTHAHNPPYGTTFVVNSADVSPNRSFNGANGTLSIAVPGSTASAGGGGVHNNMQPSIAFNKIIRT
jgi:microcystin-dependent protein